MLTNYQYELLQADQVSRYGANYCQEVPGVHAVLEGMLIGRNNVANKRLQLAALGGGLAVNNQLLEELLLCCCLGCDLSAQWVLGVCWILRHL